MVPSDVKREWYVIYGYRGMRTWEKSGGLKKCSKIKGFSDWQYPTIFPPSPPLSLKNPHHVDLGEMLGRSWKDDGKNQGYASKNMRRKQITRLPALLVEARGLFRFAPCGSVRAFPAQHRPARSPAGVCDCAGRGSHERKLLKYNAKKCTMYK